MNNREQQPKVDQTAISVNIDETLFISNINIPEHYLDNIRPVLERVFAFIQRDYIGIPLIRYNLSATYELVHKETGALRYWTGSFMPKEENLSTIDRFRILGPNFIERLLPLCNQNNIVQKLSLHGVQTVWQFQSLVSIVITVEAIVARNYHTLLLRDLLTRRNGRTRKHITFPLP